MKQIKSIKLLYLVSLSLLIFSCQESSTIGPFGKDKVPPGKVSNVQVENLAGGAKITYTLPEDEDLKAVKAEYTLESGKEKEVKSSFYKNYVDIVGYADSLEQEIKLYSVDKNENYSEPVSVTIHPKRSSIYNTFNSLRVQAAFGGLQVDASNPTREDIAILVMQENELGDLEPLPNSIYTSVDSISRAVRGLDSVRQEFSITVRDKFENYTDTLNTELKPLFETQLPSSKFSAYRLPGDTEATGNATISNLWDGGIYGFGSSYTTYEIDKLDVPNRVTFDLGQRAKISRFKIWDRANNNQDYYFNVAPKRFEIWGSIDPPADGSFNNWTKLGSFEETKPSGLPYGELSNEDVQLASAGFDWPIPISAPVVRYIRIVVLENWKGNTRLGLNEVQVYGQPQGDE